jgi:DNA-binding NarL/FixJ family response regulator
VKILKLGERGYLCKDVEPQELGEALEAVNNRGYYYTDFITGKLVQSIQHENAEKPNEREVNLINEHEKQFLELVCCELTYAEIAEKMCLSPKTIDGYRNSLFEKLRVKSRIGLVLFAIKNKLVTWD